MNPKATFCCQLFYPELVSTGQTLTELCEALSEIGVEVEVLCGPPTLLKQSEVVPRRMSYRDIDIRRVWGTRFSKLSFIGRVCNQVTYTTSMFFTLLFDASKTPLVVITNPPFLTFICAFISRLKKRPMIYVVFDVYPDTAVACGVLKPQSMMVKLWDSLNQFSFKSASKIVVLGRCMVDVLSPKLDQKEKEKLTHIHMWCDDGLMQKPPTRPNPFVEKWELQGKTVVLYSGNMGRFHDMETILEGAKLLKSHTELVFVFVGEGHKKQWAMDFVQTQGLDNCRFYSYVPREDLRDLMDLASIGLVCLMPGHEGLSVPSKTFGLMAAGVPVVGLLPETSEIALILTENNCGVVTPPQNPQAFADAVFELYQNREKREQLGQQSKGTIQKYTLKEAAQKYKELIELF